MPPRRNGRPSGPVPVWPRFRDLPPPLDDETGQAQPCAASESSVSMGYEDHLDVKGFIDRSIPPTEVILIKNIQIVTLHDLHHRA